MLNGSAAFDPVTAAIDTYTLSNSSEPMAYSDGGEDNIVLSISMNVPLWRKRIRASIAEAKNNKKATENEKERMALTLESSARFALFRIEDAQRRQSLYKNTLTPQANLVYEDLQAQYAAAESGANLLDVIESIRSMLMFELQELQAIRDWQLALADLELILGRAWMPNEAGDKLAGEQLLSETEQ